MQAARPRALMSLLQIDTLNSHGFCSSYSEVQQFSRNAAVHHYTDIPDLNGEFVQYAADNVDHNVRTLDGKDTFHGMGIISTVTPGTEHACCYHVDKLNLTKYLQRVISRLSSQ